MAPVEGTEAESLLSGAGSHGRLRESDPAGIDPTGLAGLAVAEKVGGDQGAAGLQQADDAV